MAFSEVLFASRTRNGSRGYLGLGSHFLQRRWMAKSRRVQDRSKTKRVHVLEIVTERWKIASKILLVMDALRKEPEQVMPMRKLEQYRQQLSLEHPHKVSNFIAKSPRLFEMFRDKGGAVWCGLTKQAEDLMEEEARLIGEHSEKAAEFVSRMLMMSVDKRLALDKIVHFRRDIGLPHNFRDHWIHMFPELFRQVKVDGVDHLELVSWNSAWAVTELEKRAYPAEAGSQLQTPGILSLPFPVKFPPEFKKIFRIGGKLEHFQKRSYLSPYADARDLRPGSQEFHKRAVAVMHELLSFTLEKRLVTDHLTHFRQEYVMPQKLMRLLLKHFAIFYVSERGKRFHVFLTEAYDGSELIEKCPLVLWKEKILTLTGYRGKKRTIKYFDEFSDPEGEEINLEDDALSSDSEMEVGDICNAYDGIDSPSGLPCIDLS